MDFCAWILLGVDGWIRQGTHDADFEYQGLQKRRRNGGRQAGSYFTSPLYVPHPPLRHLKAGLLNNVIV
jgi:hypothetical protein